MKSVKKVKHLHERTLDDLDDSLSQAHLHTPHTNLTVSENVSEKDGKKDKKKKRSRVILCILDGWGYSEEYEHNAWLQSRTPNIDFLIKNFPSLLLNASGTSVGLPINQMGNSEVGHMTIGSGRVIMQKLSEINQSIKKKDFYNNETFEKIFAPAPSALYQACQNDQNNAANAAENENTKNKNNDDTKNNDTKNKNGQVHILGLLSDGGIHSHEKHIYALIEGTCDKLSKQLRQRQQEQRQQDQDIIQKIQKEKGADKDNDDDAEGHKRSSSTGVGSIDSIDDAAGITINNHHIIGGISRADSGASSDFSSNFFYIQLHIILDGRDTKPKSAIKHITALLNFISQNEKKYPFIKINIATVSGRYYAMDRDQNFDRTMRVVNVIKGEKKCAFTLNLKQQKQEQEQQDQAQAISSQDVSEFPTFTTDNLIRLIQDNFYNKNITDEFIDPIKNQNYYGVSPNDLLFVANFRTDRIIQILSLLYVEFRECVTMTYCVDKLFTQIDKLSVQGFKKYSKKYNECNEYNAADELRKLNRIVTLFPEKEPKNTLGEVLELCHKTQLRLAESEKYAHVTFFFNGGRNEKFASEDRILIASPKVRTYDLAPQMSAEAITNQLLQAMQSKKYDFICTNFANLDMVGHSGNFAAAQEACEYIDHCIGKIIRQFFSFSDQRNKDKYEHQGPQQGGYESEQENQDQLEQLENEQREDKQRQYQESKNSCDKEKNSAQGGDAEDENCEDYEDKRIRIELDRDDDEVDNEKGGSEEEEEEETETMLIITADHGNIEVMYDHEEGQQHTAHSCNPVPCIIINNHLLINNHLQSRCNLDLEDLEYSGNNVTDTLTTDTGNNGNNDHDNGNHDNSNGNGNGNALINTMEITKTTLRDLMKNKGARDIKNDLEHLNLNFNKNLDKNIFKKIERFCEDYNQNYDHNKYKYKYKGHNRYNNRNYFAQFEPESEVKDFPKIPKIPKIKGEDTNKEAKREDTNLNLKLRMQNHQGFVDQDQEHQCDYTLADIAPTVLDFLNIDIPLEMSGKSLLMINDSKFYSKNYLNYLRKSNKK